MPEGFSRSRTCTWVPLVAFSPTIHSWSPMPQRTGSSYFHLHLVSDATGETLTTVARAATAQYTKVSAVEHIYPLVRTQKQLDRVLAEIEESPGIVLYTLLDDVLLQRLENHCRELSLPCLSILGPVLQLLQSYLGTETSHRVGAQHTLNADYFKRIDALNYTMLHDDGQHLEDLEEAEVVLVGVSRTSKTPTSIYLANRGVKTGNVPVVPGVQISRHVEQLSRPLVVGLYASPERIVQIRQNRLLGLRAHHDDDQYIDRKAVAEEVAFSRKLCARHNWPSIDVTRRSIEETAAAVMSFLAERRFSKPADRAGARRQLAALRGQTHELHSAVALVRGSSVLFEHREVARLTMRSFSDEFLEAYLDAAGTAVTASVGGYQLEKVGIQLFERIEGDHFTILGLPVLPLLEFLRSA